MAQMRADVCRFWAEKGAFLHKERNFVLKIS